MMYSSQYDTYDSQQSHYETGSQYTTKRQEDYTTSSVNPFIHSIYKFYRKKKC